MLGVVCKGSRLNSRQCHELRRDPYTLPKYRRGVFDPGRLLWLE